MKGIRLRVGVDSELLGEGGIRLRAGVDIGLLGEGTLGRGERAGLGLGLRLGMDVVAGTRLGARLDWCQGQGRHSGMSGVGGMGRRGRG